MSFFFGLASSKIDKRMHSPPFINVAVEATTSLTVIYCFFSAFFNADFVKAAWKIPTPYSWSRIGVSSLGTIWDSVCVMVIFYMNNVCIYEMWCVAAQNSPNKNWL